MVPISSTATAYECASGETMSPQDGQLNNPTVATVKPKDIPVSPRSDLLDTTPERCDEKSQPKTMEPIPRSSSTIRKTCDDRPVFKRKKKRKIN